jgi:hypothetical protein
MIAKRFFYVCAGLLCLAVVYHLGARNAGAQSGGTIVAAIHNPNGQGSALALAGNGDVYEGQASGSIWTYRGNVFAGPTPARGETLGRLKARYREGSR